MAVYPYEFQKGNVVVRDNKRFYVLDRNGKQLCEFPNSNPMLWNRDMGLITANVKERKIFFRIYKDTEKFSEITTEVSANSVQKILKNGSEILVLCTDEDGENKVLKLAFFSNKCSPIRSFVLKDPSGKAEVLDDKKAMIHDALCYHDRLWISGYPSHSGGMSCYSIVTASKNLEELTGLFSEEDLRGETEKNLGKRIKTLSGIAGNNRGIVIYNDSDFVSVCTNPPGKLTVFSSETGDKYVLTNSIDTMTGVNWGFHAILVLNEEILVTNCHQQVGKIYRIDKKSGEVKGIFASGIPGIEMIEIE